VKPHGLDQVRRGSIVKLNTKKIESEIWMILAELINSKFLPILSCGPQKTDRSIFDAFVLHAAIFSSRYS